MGRGSGKSEEGRDNKKGRDNVNVLATQASFLACKAVKSINPTCPSHSLIRDSTSNEERDRAAIHHPNAEMGNSGGGEYIN
jgi:hypothetical protein